MNSFRIKARSLIALAICVIASSSLAQYPRVPIAVADEAVARHAAAGRFSDEAFAKARRGSAQHALVMPGRGIENLDGRSVTQGLPGFVRCAASRLGLFLNRDEVALKR